MLYKFPSPIFHCIRMQGENIAGHKISGDVYFSSTQNIFCHLNLEIVLATPVLNERKIGTNNSAAQGCKIKINK